MLELPEGHKFDPGIAWDDIGIDMLIVDEAAAFKNSYKPEAREHGLPKFMGSGGDGSKRAWQLDSDPAESSPRPRRIGWAKLIARVFALDITRCRKCGGRMRVLEVVSDPGRHRPHLARRPRSACASSSRPAPVAPLTARTFGDVFTLPRPAAVLAAPLGLLAAHFVTRALPLAPWTVPKSSDRGLRRSPPDRSVLTLAPKFLHQNP